MRSQSFVTGVLPSASATGVHRPVDATGVEVTGGFWHTRLEDNRTRTLPHGVTQLHRAHNLDNFAALIDGGEYTAGRDDSGAAFPFLDSDVYKWLEGAGWELGREHDKSLAAAADEMIDLISRAQRADGYLNTYVQLTTPGHEFEDLRWAHELYSAGHLIQAAIAWHRALGDDRLLQIAIRCADRIDAEFGPTGRDGTDGHPQIEMALVELYRVTGAERFLTLAGRVIEARGHGLLGADRFGPQYWQDHTPVRCADHPAGHAVRQLYLDCGVVDFAVETGDDELLASVVRRWEEMVRNRSYVNGAVGSHHRDESFGDPYELPPDRAYAETCGAIAGVMLSWRLLLATGEARYADHAERTMYNAVLSGIALDATHFFYVNPLQRRDGHEPEGPGASSYARAEWFACACCPPNLMRFFASWPQYLVTTAGNGIAVQQYADASVSVAAADGPTRLTISTDYPWDGTVNITVAETPGSAWPLQLRVPSWAEAVSLQVNGADLDATPVDGYVAVDRTWQSGDTVTLSLAMSARRVVADRRIDAIRGCVAVQRGPLLFCLEQADLPDGVALEDLQIVGGIEDNLPSPLPGIPLTVGVTVAALEPTEPEWPYLVDRQDVASTDDDAAPTTRASWTQPLVPYFAWANRSVGAMRVWIPTASAGKGNHR